MRRRYAGGGDRGQSQPGGLTAEILTTILDDMVLVAEREIERAVTLLLNVEKTVVEGAGAAGLAAVLTDPDRFRGRNIGLVLCGGNIDPSCSPRC